MEAKRWTLTINMLDYIFDKPLESMSLEMDNINDCITIIELFQNNGITFSKDVYYQFILE